MPKGWLAHFKKAPENETSEAEQREETPAEARTGTQAEARIELKPNDAPEPIAETESTVESETIDESESIAEPEPRIEPKSEERPRMRVLQTIQDTRHVTLRERARQPEGDFLLSRGDLHLPIRLYIEAEAVAQIFRFIHWGERVPENSLEQAALMYGRLCEADGARWGEVCGIIPARTPRATSASVLIEAQEWSCMYNSLDEINARRGELGEENMVCLGWLHTHPDRLNVLFSSYDIELQRDIMNNNDLFGVVFNPHRRIFACYADASSRQCLAALTLDSELRAHYNLEPEPDPAPRQAADRAAQEGAARLKLQHSDSVRSAVYVYESVYQPNVRLELFNARAGAREFRLRQQQAINVSLEDSERILRCLPSASGSVPTVALVNLTQRGRGEACGLELMTYLPLERFSAAKLKWLENWYVFFPVSQLSPQAARCFEQGNPVQLVEHLYRSLDRAVVPFNVLFYQDAPRPRMLICWVDRCTL